MAFFSKELKLVHGANAGAYSQVTKREATGDKSVTLDLNEKDVIFSVYPPSSFARKGGARESHAISPYKDFIVHYPNGTTRRVSLSVVYPKIQGNELRLYFKRHEFEAGTGDYWFIFTKDNEDIPHIGSIDSITWGSQIQLNQTRDSQKIAYQAQQNIDEEDENYQRQIGAAAVKIATLTSSFKYPRSAAVALRVLEKAHYSCEVDNQHPTFISISAQPYMECHHLIPISSQPKFEASLDVEENVISLCPLCHRQIHYGTGESRLSMLNKLWRERHSGLLTRGIDIRYEDFIKIYMN